MREPMFKLILGYLGQLVQATSTIGFYAHVIADIEKQKKALVPQYDAFVEQIKDKKHTAKLTIEEQQALGENETNFKHVLHSMDNTMTYLLKQKWAPSINRALWLLDDVVLMAEDAVSGVYDLEELATEIKLKNLIDQKRFDKADYLTKISLVQIAINTLRDDVMDEGFFGEAEVLPFLQWGISTGLGKTLRMLQRELQDVEVNGLPKTEQFELPKVVVPEIPEEAPEPKQADAAELTEAEQKEVDFIQGVAMDKAAFPEEKKEPQMEGVATPNQQEGGFGLETETVEATK